MAGKFKADLVPRHYELHATIDARGMIELIISLRRFVDEFDAPQEVVDLLEALESVFAGDLPQQVVLPEPDEDDDDNGEEELAEK